MDNSILIDYSDKMLRWGGGGGRSLQLALIH